MMCVPNKPRRPHHKVLMVEAVIKTLYTSILALFSAAHPSWCSRVDRRPGRSTRERWQWLQSTRHSLQLHRLPEKLLAEDGNQRGSEWEISRNKWLLPWSYRSRTERWCSRRHTSDIRGSYRRLHWLRTRGDSRFAGLRVLQNTNPPSQSTKGCLGFSMGTNSSSWPDNWLRKLQGRGDNPYGVGGLAVPSMNLNSQTGLKLSQEGKQGNVNTKKYLDDITVTKILGWNLKKKESLKVLRLWVEQSSLVP